jgi:hypothetical protein
MLPDYSSSVSGLDSIALGISACCKESNAANKLVILFLMKIFNIIKKICPKEGGLYLEKY